MFPLAILALNLAPATTAVDDGDIPYTKFVLDNGLQVLVHEDHTDSIVTVCVDYHVGSTRDVPGKTGLAHLFEHLMFKGSEHVPDGEHMRMVKEAGGFADGQTTFDLAEYFETLPSCDLELALWLESDRMGFLLPSLDQAKLDSVIAVVKDERREKFDQQPSEMVSDLIAATLFPKDHPYSWSVVGSHDDLASITLQDVRSFAEQWYGPNTATLSIGGDVDPDVVRKLVDEYFGPLKPCRGGAGFRGAIPPLQHGSHEIIEADVPSASLQCAWPLPPLAGSDEAALLVLRGVLDRMLTRQFLTESNRATNVEVAVENRELGGFLEIGFQSAPGAGLDALDKELMQTLDALADGGVDQVLVNRDRNRGRTASLSSVDSVTARTRSLGWNNVVTNRPGALHDRLHWTADLSPEDVTHALRAYVSRRPHVTVSLVPKTHRDLASKELDSTEDGTHAQTSLDRTHPPIVSSTKAPAAGPKTWHVTLENGVPVTGITRPGSPLCSLNIVLPMGLAYGTGEDLGVPGLLSGIAMCRITGAQAEEFTAQWNLMGGLADVGVTDSTLLSITIPAEKLAATGRKLNDVLTRPDFDKAGLDALKIAIAGRVFNDPVGLQGRVSPAVLRQVFGKGPVGASLNERFQSLQSITLDDFRAYWDAHVVPAGSSIAFVGPLGPDEIVHELAALSASWKSPSVAPVHIVSRPLPALPTRILLHNRPRSIQCRLIIAQAGIQYEDADWVAFSTAADILGGGDLISRASHRLREELGYTYQCMASAEGSSFTPVFQFTALVETSHAVSALDESMKLVRGMLDGPTDAELALVKSANARKKALRWVSVKSCTTRLVDRVLNGWPDDLETRWDEEISNLTVEQVRDAVRRHLDPDHMIIVVDGDATKLREGLTRLGLGDVVDVDSYGDPIKATANMPNPH